MKLAREEVLVRTTEEGQVVIDFFSQASGHSDKQLDWPMMWNKALLLYPMSGRGSDKESTLSAEYDGNKTLSSKCFHEL